jgi:hypothetical protein
MRNFLQTKIFLNSGMVILGCKTVTPCNSRLQQCTPSRNATRRCWFSRGYAITGKYCVCALQSRPGKEYNSGCMLSYEGTHSRDLINVSCVWLHTTLIGKHGWRSSGSARLSPLWSLVRFPDWGSYMSTGRVVCWFSPLLRGFSKIADP